MTLSSHSGTLIMYLNCTHTSTVLYNNHFNAEYIQHMPNKQIINRIYLTLNGALQHSSTQLKRPKFQAHVEPLVTFKRTLKLKLN